MNRLLIKNARLINEGEIRDADVLVEGERIAKVASGVEAPGKATVIDAAGNATYYVYEGEDVSSASFARSKTCSSG